MHVWRAVRCCCKPQKIFGFILVEERAKEIVLVNQIDGTRVHFPIAVSSEIHSTSKHLTQIGEQTENDFIEYTRELAIKSEDHPIEFWRRQKGFVEVHRHGDRC